MSAASELRVGDADRQQAVDQLSEQFALGRLSNEEFDERSDAAWSARTRGDLAPLFADLPIAASATPLEQPANRRRPGPPAWRGAGRFVAPVVLALVVPTVLTHLPFVLLAVGIWLLVGRRRWHHHGYAVHHPRGRWAA